jgi:ATP-dependent Clp protease ATP-binding subunit ClpC
MPGARKWLADKGFDPAFGARPLRRALQKYVESPLSISLLSGEFQTGQTIVVDVDPENDNLVFRPHGESVPAAAFDQISAQN